MSNRGNLFYNMVKNGKLALDKVPLPYQEEVTKMLESESDE